jgi:signal transduction histidine kinase
MNSRVSVGRRLHWLVGVQTAIAVLLVLLAYHTISAAEADYRRMYHFQFRPVAAIGEAMQEAATLQTGAGSSGLDDFYSRYRAEWEVASGTNPDAVQFRKELMQAGATHLLGQETKVLDDLHESLQSGKPDGVRKDLAALYDLNVKYADLDNRYVLDKVRKGRNLLIVIGLAGIAFTLVLGVWVERAAIPRAKNMIAHVRHFQDHGTYERIADSGDDEIGVLANALDAGFSAIVSREKDRDQFLAIVAHELKTPVTSIYGYASLLARHSMSMKETDNAIQAINRQSWRLIRLIDSVLLTGKARSGELRFIPAPVDASKLVSRVLEEMMPLLGGKAFSSKIEPDISLLGDEALLEHALWSLFTSAWALSGKDEPVKILLRRIPNRALLTVDTDGGNVSAAEVRDLFLPFRFVEYETGSGIRSGIGLYTCREIIRLHNGTMRVEQTEGRPAEFFIELPI